MKTTKSNELIKYVKDLFTIRDRLKALKREESELKDILKAELEDKDTDTLLAGELILILSEKIRTDLDREALTKALGDGLKEYEKKVKYEVLEVKRA